MHIHSFLKMLKTQTKHLTSKLRSFEMWHNSNDTLPTNRTETSEEPFLSLLGCKFRCIDYGKCGFFFIIFGLFYLLLIDLRFQLSKNSGFQVICVLQIDISQIRCSQVTVLQKWSSNVVSSRRNQWKNSWNHVSRWPYCGSLTVNPRWQPFETAFKTRWSEQNTTSEGHWRSNQSNRRPNKQNPPK